MTFIYVKFQFPLNTENPYDFSTKKMVRKTAAVHCEQHVTLINVTQSEMLKTFLKALLVLKFRLELTFKRRIKSHLPFAGIIRSSPPKGISTLT